MTLVKYSGFVVILWQGMLLSYCAQKYNLRMLPALFYTRRNIIQKIYSVCIKRREIMYAMWREKKKNDRW